MPTYAVGDIQGCLQPLQKLLDHVSFGSGDYLWIAGDLINRGPQSLQTLRFIYSIKDLVQIVLGNHDLHLLAHHAVFQDAPLNKTLQPIMQAHDRNQLMNWLQNQPILHYDQVLDTVMTHAGIPPYWDLSQAIQQAMELEQVLRGNQADEFFTHMYGNQPDQWDERLQNLDLWRFIANSFTRMRFLHLDGRLEFRHKGGIFEAPKHLIPWFKLPPKVKARQVFGHWASLKGETGLESIVSLDGGCVWGGCLKLICLETCQNFSVACA